MYVCSSCSGCDEDRTGKDASAFLKYCKSGSIYDFQCAFLAVLKLTWDTSMHANSVSCVVSAQVAFRYLDGRKIAC